MSDDSPRTVVLNKATLVPVGVVLSVAAALFGSWAYLENRFDGLRGQLESNGHRLEKLEEHADERWTYTEQKLWVSEFRRLNPSMEIPEASR